MTTLATCPGDQGSEFGAAPSAMANRSLSERDDGVNEERHGEEAAERKEKEQWSHEDVSDGKSDSLNAVSCWSPAVHVSFIPRYIVWYCYTVQSHYNKASFFPLSFTYTILSFY